MVSGVAKAVKIMRRKFFFNLKPHIVLSYLRLRNLTMEVVSQIFLFWKENKMRSDFSKNTSEK